MEQEQLEKLRESWNKWNATCHPEDRLSWVDYLGECDIYLDDEY